jgi:hypothetical protein
MMFLAVWQISAACRLSSTASAGLLMASRCSMVSRAAASRESWTGVAAVRAEMARVMMYWAFRLVVMVVGG